MTDKQRKAYNDGWSHNGEWKCPACQTMIGKNLLDQRPFLLAAQHVVKCQQLAGKE